MKRSLLLFIVSSVGAAVAAEPLKAALYVDDGCRGSGVIRWAETLNDSTGSFIRREMA